MTRAQIEALLLLAGIEYSTLVKIPNQYWPPHADYDEVRNKNPWWLVITARGTLEIGWRKRVIHIDWAGWGVVYPLVTDQDKSYASDEHLMRKDNTKWPTGCHAYGYGEAVEVLSALNNIYARWIYLRKYWKENPAKPEDMKDWLVRATKKSWHKVGEEHLEFIINAANKTRASEILLERCPGYSLNLVMVNSEYMEQMKALGIHRDNCIEDETNAAAAAQQGETNDQPAV